MDADLDQGQGEDPSAPDALEKSTAADLSAHGLPDLPEALPDTVEEAARQDDSDLENALIGEIDIDPEDGRSTIDILSELSVEPAKLMLPQESDISEAMESVFAQLKVGSSVTFGRSAENDVVSGASTVSRKHAEIELAEDGYYRVTDLGSTHGTSYREEGGEWEKIKDSTSVAPGTWVRVANGAHVFQLPERERERGSAVEEVELGAQVVVDKEEEADVLGSSVSLPSQGASAMPGELEQQAELSRLLEEATKAKDLLNTEHWDEQLETQLSAESWVSPSSAHVTFHLEQPGSQYSWSLLFVFRLSDEAKESLGERDLKGVVGQIHKLETANKFVVTPHESDRENGVAAFSCSSAIEDVVSNMRTKWIGSG